MTCLLLLAVGLIVGCGGGLWYGYWFGRSENRHD